MEQLSFTLARRSDPETSQSAAVRSGEFRARHVSKIYAALGCLNYREIAALTGLEPVAVGRRLKGMEVSGLIRRAGERDGMTLWEKIPCSS